MYREMDEMRRAALGHRAEIVAQTRAEAEAQVAEAITRLDAEAAEARRKLEADAQTLGAAAADRILGRKAS
jgi:F0F1-type ATP synthase membrane subunit b/b'